MKKQVVSILLAMATVASMLAGCANTQTPSSSSSTQGASTAPSAQPKEEKILLKLNHVMSNTDPAHAAFEKLGQVIGEKSGGSIEVQVYGNSELGSNKDNLEQIKSGANIISVADGALLSDYVPDYGIMHGPFLYESNENLQNLYNSEWHDSIEKACSDKGIKVLAMNWYFGERHIISKKPIQTPADLKGVKVRVPSATMWVETMKAMGATPTTLQWSEVYSGLEQGVVEAAEAPLSTIYTSKLQEAAKNIALTGHFTGIIGLEMSQKVWDSMSPEQQTIISEAVKSVGEEYSASVISSESEWRTKLEAEGVTFYEVDKALFAEASKDVYNKFPEWTPGLYETVKGFL